MSNHPKAMYLGRVILLAHKISTEFYYYLAFLWEKFQGMSTQTPVSKNTAYYGSYCLLNRNKLMAPKKFCWCFLP